MKYEAFIISHGRSDRVETYDTLRNAGYTGKINVVIDNRDKQLQQYQDRFRDNLIVFDKQYYIDKTDTITNDKKDSSPVYARNAVEDLAKYLDAFIMIDDDVTNLRYRYLENDVVKSQKITKNMDNVFDDYIEYLINGNISTLSFATAMVYAGGIHSESDKRRLASHRYTCQIHIRNTKFRVNWISLANNDSITGGITAKIGYLWWLLPFVAYDSPKMNTLPGGMKSVYDEESSFRRSFMATVALPSVNNVGVVKDRFNIHRNLKSAYPMIISSEYKK